MSGVKKGFDCKKADRAAVISSDYGNSNEWMGDMTKMVDTGSTDANSRMTDAHSRLDTGHGGVNRKSERADRVINIGGYHGNSCEQKKEVTEMVSANSLSTNGKTSDRVPMISGGLEETSKRIQVCTQAQTFRSLTGASRDHAPGLIETIGAVNAKGWTPGQETNRSTYSVSVNGPPHGTTKVTGMANGMIIAGAETRDKVMMGT